MSYLWIVLIVFVALSPLVSALPSRRQRKVAALREAAALNGLYVQFRRPPPRTGMEDRLSTFYGCRRLRTDPPFDAEIFYRLTDGKWERWGSAAPIPALNLLSTLPPGVEVVWIDQVGAGVFWDECGEAGDVVSIAEVLRGILTSH